MLCCYHNTPGPPESMELLALTQKLAGVLKYDWSLLAGPLAIPDHELASTDYEEKTLIMKINRLLRKWIDLSRGNDRVRLASLLGEMEGYNLNPCLQQSLRTV